MPAIEAVRTRDSEGVVTFTDETTPLGLSTGLARVIVAAQCADDQPLEWYYDLLKWIAVDGELKSAVVLQRLSDLHRDVSEAVWCGVRKARVHIVDARPYVLDLRHGFLESGDTWVFSEETRSHPVMGKHLREFELEFVAEQVLWDSRAEQLARHIEVVVEYGFVDVPAEDQLTQMHRRLKDELKNKLNHTLLLTARSGSAFAQALDYVSPPGDVMTLQGYSAQERQRLGAELRRRHRFDRGNEKVVGMLEGLRHEFEQLMGYSPFDPPLPDEGPYLVEIDSISSEHVRAADIAAGLAASLYRTGGLVDVVRRFEYVEFNGTRMSEAAAITEAGRISAARRDLSATQHHQ